MRRIHFLLWGCLCFFLQHSAIAQPQVQPKTAYLNFSLGFGEQALKELNAEIEEDEQLFREAGAPVSFNTFRGGLDLGGEFGYYISRDVSLEVSVHYQKRQITDKYSDSVGSISIERNLSILSITGHLVIWAPSPQGLHLVLGIGDGSGKISSGSSIVIFSDASYNSQAEGSWKGSNLTTEAFVGYRLHLAPALGLQFRGGYRFRKLGPFDGSLRSPQFGYVEAPYVNNEGDSVEFDFSGIYLTAGLSVVLGPPRERGK